MNFANINKSQSANDPIREYINVHSLRLTSEQKKLIDRSMSTPGFYMLGSTDELQLFQLILKATNAKRVLDIGTYTGYSALTMALALSADNSLVITCDLNDEHVARDIWQEANVAHKIRFEKGPACDTLERLISQEKLEETFDFAFIDADKVNYLNYYELCLKLVRKNGIIAVDNVLWYGRVIDTDPTDPSTIAIKQFNEHLKKDDRIDISMINIGDGVTLCRKK